MTLVEGTTDPLWVLPTLPLWVLVAKFEGLYDADHPRIWHLTTDEVPAIFHWVTLSVAGSLFFIRALPNETVTLKSALALYLAALVAAFLFRSVARGIWRRRVPPERALVMGHGKLADAVARKLALEPGHHLSVLEYTSNENGNGNGASHREFKLEELTREDLEFLLSETGIERVVLAVPELDEATLARVVASCRATGVELSVMPPMRAMLGTAVQLNHIAEMPVIEYGTWGTSWSTMALKRVVDVVLSAAGIVILAPLMLIIALAVRFTSEGPALFRQIRAGRDGKPFKILKFRTMCHDAEERISEVISPDELDEPMFKLREDPRVTKVGRFLRRTSLDELPQLLNVLRGDMSLVGPRPCLPTQAELIEARSRLGALGVLPGVTGLAQIHGVDMSDPARLAVIDAQYARTRTFGGDLVIILRTLTGSGMNADSARTDLPRERRGADG
jgi:exopolysaccharide biosynthesis polyprenyl glycosylphosphotransferase